MRALKYIAISGLLLLAACEKDKLPEPSSENPVFSFQGIIGGQQVNLIAGEDDYYMYAGTSTDGTGLKNFTAELAPASCQTCANSLKITIFDYALSIPTSTELDSSLYLGYYNYATSSGKASRYDLSFDAFFTAGAVTTGVLWDFGDGKSKQETDPLHRYVRPGKYEVCASSGFIGGGNSNLCNALVLGSIGDEFQAQFNANNVSGTSFNFSGSSLNGQAPVTYLWDFGDGNTSIDQNVAHTYASEGAYTISLTATDASGKTAVFRNNYRTQNSNLPVLRYNASVVPVSNPQNMGNVLIEWRDANGKLYSSQNDLQPQGSTFKILSIEPYQNNEKGQATKKMRVQFSCELYNGAEVISLRDAEAIIAVAY